MALVGGPHLPKEMLSVAPTILGVNGKSKIVEPTNKSRPQSSGEVHTERHSGILILWIGGTSELLVAESPVLRYQGEGPQPKIIIRAELATAWLSIPALSSFFAGQVSKSQNLKAVWQKQTFETSVELASESQTQEIRRKRDLLFDASAAAFHSQTGWIKRWGLR